MMPLVAEEKIQLLAQLPFPLAYLYQDLLASQALLENPAHAAKEYDVAATFWKLLSTVRLLNKLVAIVAASDYLAGKEATDQKRPLAGAFLEAFASQAPQWRQLSKNLIPYLAKANLGVEAYHIPELAELASPSIYLELTPPAELTTELSSRKGYTWLELMELFDELENQLFEGKYRGVLPSPAIRAFYIELLGIALQSCPVLTQYNIYLLLSRDERKTRGFMCQGVRSQPLGIRHISTSFWNSLKGKPFLTKSGDKHKFLPLFPLLVPSTQKQGERTIFCDLLSYEYGTRDKIYFYGHRLQQTIAHEQCAPAALGVWQKELRFLERLVSKEVSLATYIIPFTAMTTYHSQSFVGRREVLAAIAQFLRDYAGGYFYLQGKSGTGKTALFSAIYQAAGQKNGLTDLFPGLENHPRPVFAWHFFGELAKNDEPMVFLKSLYGQILQQLYQPAPATLLTSLQKLPIVAENLQKSLEKLLEQASKEILQPKNLSLVIMLDGADEQHLEPSVLHDILAALPARLPERVFCCLAVQAARPSTASKLSLSQLVGGHSAWVELPKVSPLVNLTYDEVAQWLAALLPGTEDELEPVIQQLWEKSGHGDPCYLGLLQASGLITNLAGNNWEKVPNGRNGLLDWFWENLSQDDNFLSYQIAGLVAEMRHFASDDIFAGITGKPLEVVQKSRWSLSPLLRYASSSTYTIAYPLLRHYLHSRFGTEDRREFHRQLAKYYLASAAGEKTIYKRLSDEAMRHLAYHYSQAGSWNSLYDLVSDSDFKEEKLKRFKSYQDYLADLTTAMQAGIAQKQYEEVLWLGYRYSALVTEALQGLAHAFRIAAQRNYELALERVRIVRDEQDQFKAMLIVLWHALYNEDFEQAGVILEEIGRIPDDQICFCIRGLERFVAFLLQKLQKNGINRIDHLIGKHGFKGKEAIQYLLKLQSDLGFSKEQFYYFFQKLLAAANQLLSSKEKKEAFEEVLALALKAERLGNLAEIWRQLLPLAENIADLTLRLDAMKNWGNTVLSLDEKEYLAYFAQAVARGRNATESAENKAVHFVQYAGLLRLTKQTDEARRFVEDSFLHIEKEKADQLPDFFRMVFAELEESKDSLPREWSDKIFLLLKKLSDESHKLGLLEVAVVSLAYRGEFGKAFKLLQQGGFAEADSLFATLKKMIRSLKFIVATTVLPYWHMVLEQVAYLKDQHHFCELLDDILLSLGHLKITETDPIWNRYILIAEKLKEMGAAPLRDRLFANIACMFAEKGFLEKAREVISYISDEKLCSAPLSEFGIQWIRKKSELGVALDVLPEIALVQDQLRVLAFIVNHIPPGDSGRSLWKRITISLQTLHWHDEGEAGWDVYFFHIMAKLMEDLPLDESDPLWQDIFHVLEGLPYDSGLSKANPAYTQNMRDLGASGARLAIISNNKLRLLEEFLAALGKTGVFEKTTAFWPLIERIISQTSQPYIRARLHTSVAIALSQLGQIWEANAALEKASACIRDELNPVLVLEAMAKIGSGYRELGKESKCREIFEEILHYSGISQGKKIKNWDPHDFIIYLSSLGLEDLGLIILEKILLALVETGEQSPPPDTLLSMAELCSSVGHYNHLREILFRLLPLLAKESSLQGQSPMYVRIGQLLDKIRDERVFREIWERTAEMVLNLPRVAMQEYFLEGLSNILKARGDYAAWRPLWEKLLHNAGYIGSQLEAMRSYIRIGKAMAGIAPWEVVQAIFQSQWDKVSQILSEYDQMYLVEMLAEMLAASPFFSKAQGLWNELLAFVKRCKRPDSQGLGLMGLGKILARRAREYQEWELVADSGKIIALIQKPQQKCEAYLAIAKEYQLADRKDACMATLQQAMDIGKNLGSFYQTKLLPILVEIQLALGEWESVLHNIAAVPEPLPKIALTWKTLQQGLDKGYHQQTTKLLQQTIPLIRNSDPQYGEQSRLYAMAAAWSAKLGDPTSIVPLFDKAMAGWEAIMNATYQKDTVIAILAVLESLGQEPALLPLWQKIAARAKSIEQESHRLLALQELGKGLARTHRFGYLAEIFALLPIGSDARLQVLSVYLEEIPAQEALSLVQTATAEDKIVLIKKLAAQFDKKDYLEGLFELWLEMPGQFSLLCELTTKILSVAAKTKTRGCFSRWFTQIAPAWGLEKIGKSEG